MTTKANQMSCREGGQSDYKKGLKDKLTGWGQVSKKRSNPNSASQRRKANK